MRCKHSLPSKQVQDMLTLLRYCVFTCVCVCVSVHVCAGKSSCVKLSIQGVRNWALLATLTQTTPWCYNWIESLPSRSLCSGFHNHCRIFKGIHLNYPHIAILILIWLARFHTPVSKLTFMSTIMQNIIAAIGMILGQENTSALTEHLEHTNVTPVGTSD